MAAPDQVFDVLIVGGGINGAGIACDAAGRGLSVLLCEQGDLGQATSSASSKLIHGGLRYLEYYEFRLVREALAEREVLLAKAPHIIRPLRFVLPLGEGMRPAWLVRLGLFLYDHIGPHPNLPNSRSVDLTSDPFGAPLRPHLKKGFAYSDCWVDDARLVVLNAIGAAQRGATILPRTKLAAARRTDGLWEARLEDRQSGETHTVHARTMVNATGPWVQLLRRQILGTGGDSAGTKVRLVKGSHIVVPRLHEGDHAYILQNPDRRVVFVLPFENRFSLIGTTEVPFHGDPGSAGMDAEEVSYLCAAVGAYFARPVVPADSVWSFTGVRPLIGDEAEDPSALTRDYTLELDTAIGGAPLLSVIGGKITTYRRLAEQALARLNPYLSGMGRPWTARAALPGGDMAGGDMAGGGLDALVRDLASTYFALDTSYLHALARRHGSLCAAVLGDARKAADLGPDFGAGLYGREVDYLVRREWARTAEDVLWRRTKCGLQMSQAARRAVGEYMYAGAGAGNGLSKTAVR